MKKFKELLEKNWFAYTFAACVGVVLYVLLTHMQGIGSFFSAFKSVISPVICGAVMAYLMNPLCNHFERKIFDKIKREKLRHSLSVITTVLLVVIAIVLLLVALVPSLIQSISLLVSNVPQYMENLEANIDRMSLSLARYGIDAEGIEKAIEKALSDLLADIPENMGTILSTSVTVGSSLFNLVIGFILAVYFLSDKESFRMGLKRFRHAILTDKAYSAHSSFWKKCHEILIRYIGFDVLEGIIVGVVNALFMVIVKMPYISLISVLVGVTNLVPTFGPFIGAGIGAFILVLVDPMQALIFLIFTLVLQLIDGYILKPKLFGGSLGVSAAWVLVSIVVGGKLFGVAGIVLAIPFAAIISFIYDELAMPLLLKRKAKNEKEELQSEEEK